MRSVFAAVVFFVLASAAAARADGRPTPARDGGSDAAAVEQKAPPDQRSSTGTDQAPLSEEDRALLRELALLERVELLRDLDLFEPAGQQRAKKTSQ